MATNYNNLSENGKWAVAYAKRGIKVFPLHYPIRRGDALQCSCRKPDCDRIGKHPLTPHGFEDASSDISIVQKWWWANPNANIGIATGAMSGFDVIDVDVGGEDSFSMLEDEHGKLPDTVTVLTGGGGTHYWVLHTEGLGSKVGILPHLDVRADGGYIVAPPSMHRSGTPYVFDAANDFTGGVAPAQLPAEWAQLLLDLCKKKSADSTAHNSPATDTAPIPQGQRNDTIYRLACSYRAKGLSEAALTAAVKAENLARCKPPLDDGEVAVCIRQALQHDAGHSAQWDAEHTPRSANAHESGAQAATEPKKKQTRFTGILTLQELFTKDIPPIDWIWSERVTTGLMLLAGAQKMGKSFLMLGLSLAVAAGEPFLGRGTSQGDVLYLALEDSERRMRHRVSQMIGTENLPPSFSFTTDAPSQGEGLEECIQAWCEEHPARRLVVVDTYGHVKKTVRTAGTSMTAYDADVKNYTPLQKLSMKNGICICLVTHLKKGAAGDDLMDRINGSNGQAATADCIFQLIGKRQAGNGGKNIDMALHMQGRDISGDELPLEFDGRTWTVRTIHGATEQDKLTYAMYQWAMQVVANMPQRMWHGSASMLQDELARYTATMHADFRSVIPRSAGTFARCALAVDRLAMLETQCGVVIEQDEHRKKGQGSPWWTVRVEEPQEDEKEEELPFV